MFKGLEHYFSCILPSIEPHDCFWLNPEVQPPEIDFRSSPNNGHSEAHAGLPVTRALRQSIEVQGAIFLW